MNQYSTKLSILFNSAVQNRQLIYQLTKREIVGKYRGSFFGLFWSLFNPLIMLAVYTFVFGVIFKAKWGVGVGEKDENQLDFAIILFAGLTIFNLFSENFNRAPSLITSNVNYVKKIIFPLEILPFITFLSSLFHMLISLGILFVMFGVTHGYLNWTSILLVPILIPYTILILASMYLLAAVGVFLKDVGHLIGHISTILLFTSPVFFSLARIPEQFRIFLYFNPLSLFLESSRNVLIFGIVPNWILLSINLFISLIALKVSFWIFQKARKGFADVI